MLYDLCDNMKYADMHIYSNSDHENKINSELL